MIGLKRKLRGFKLVKLCLENNRPKGLRRESLNRLTVNAENLKSLQAAVPILENHEVIEHK